MLVQRLDDLPEYTEEEHILVPVAGLILPGQKEIINMCVDTKTKEWRAFEEVWQEVARTRHPSDSLLAELHRRREEWLNSLTPMFAMLHAQEQLANMGVRRRKGQA